MASRRYKKQAKSTKCPEPFNTMIDLAAAATLDYIAHKRKQKHGSSRAKIDPYAAAGVAHGMGKLNTTEDMIQLGGMLGAMGAFDDNEDAMDTVLQYGISREDYQTRDEYVTALNEARFNSPVNAYEDTTLLCDEDNLVDELVLCRVSCLDSGINAVYYSHDASLRPGEIVIVPNESGKMTKGVVLTVERFADEETAEICDEIQEIIGRANE